MGVFWAFGSMLLVSIAQLLLRRAMLELDLRHWQQFFQASADSYALLAGLGCYLASMVCWFMALRRIALSKACSLLSLSYALVWGIALVMPGQEEPFRWGGALGVLLIIAGVAVIFSPVRGRGTPR